MFSGNLPQSSGARLPNACQSSKGSCSPHVSGRNLRAEVADTQDYSLVDGVDYWDGNPGSTQMGLQFSHV